MQNFSIYLQSADEHIQHFCLLANFSWMDAWSPSPTAQCPRQHPPWQLSYYFCVFSINLVGIDAILDIHYQGLLSTSASDISTTPLLLDKTHLFPVADKQCVRLPAWNKTYKNTMLLIFIRMHEKYYLKASGIAFHKWIKTECGTRTWWNLMWGLLAYIYTDAWKVAVTLPGKTLINAEKPSSKELLEKSARASSESCQACSRRGTEWPSAAHNALLTTHKQKVTITRSWKNTIKPWFYWLVCENICSI